jgi:hypothetical protein
LDLLFEDILLLGAEVGACGLKSKQKRLKLDQLVLVKVLVVVFLCFFLFRLVRFQPECNGTGCSTEEEGGIYMCGGVKDKGIVVGVNGDCLDKVVRGDNEMLWIGHCLVVRILCGWVH